MLINDATKKFIAEHAADDVRKLALQGAKQEDVDLQQALQQIAGRQTARKKLASWAAVEDIVYPPHLNMEQCSSEQTARYKQRLVERLMTSKRVNGASRTVEMDSFVDLIGGFGVDFYWMSQGFKQRHYVEQNPALCALAEHNFRLLALECMVVCGSAADTLHKLPRASVIYLDPARRNEHGGRTFDIADCTPNVLEMLPSLLEKSHFIVVKLSPMLDWRKAVSDLKYVLEVHIVSVGNECKELLLVLSKEQTEKLQVFCVNDDSVSLFVPVVGTHSTNSWYAPYQPVVPAVPAYFTAAGKYLFEPNASIMKAGCFREVEQQYAVRQLSANSHLFISDADISDFPGRRFQISSISSMNKQELKAALKEIPQANIAVRNFPLSAEQLRKKLKLKDGGDTYIFATTQADGQHRLYICRKIG